MADRLKAGKGGRTRVLWAACIASIATVGALGASSSHAQAGIISYSAEPMMLEPGIPATQAGGHPDLEVYIEADTRSSSPLPDPSCECNDPRIIRTHMPTGFIGNPHNVPKCTLAEFATRSCVPESQVGVLEVFGPVPVYNMETHPDEAGLIAFELPLVNGPGFLTISARTGSDYGLDTESAAIFHLIPIPAPGLPYIDLFLWGVPADPIHDRTRFPQHYAPISGCNVVEIKYPEGCYAPVPSNATPKPYLQNPTTCGVPLTSTLDLEYYDGTVDHADAPWPATTGCDQLSFNPSLTAAPTTQQADTASGLDVALSIPQTQSPTVPSPSELRTVTTTLPEGFSINPNAADGKTTCSDTEASFGTEKAARCPEHAKVGTLQIDSSALPGPIDGAVYLGEPLEGDPYRLILTADGFATHVKLAGSVHPDPVTGRIVVAFSDLPQSPFSRFSMHFFGSERGILATPSHCGTYPVKSEFVPWDAALSTQISTAFFTIDVGPSNVPCPGDIRPFNPRLEAGSADNTAGAHSTFALRLDRDDGDQFLRSVNVSTALGFSAVLKGIPYCPEAALAAVSDPNASGLTEISTPTCPQASQIGTAVSGAGAGSRPLHTPGKVYLAGPYKGAPLSLAVVIPAVSGPYDLGNAVVRAAIFVDPASARVTTVSDPLPQILEGIPLRVRSVLVKLDRPRFALNPTNCDPFSIDAEIFGAEGGIGSPRAHFQAANCSDLLFQPKLGLKLLGPTNRRGHPALRAVLRAGPGEANLRRTVVEMPKAEQLENAHIATICTRVQYAADACPPGSIYGTAEATTPLLDEPLRGPVFLRASNHILPDLVVSLRGQISVELVGRIDTGKSGGIRTTFASVPDAPVSRFELNLFGGPRGLLVNSQDLCKHTKRAGVEIAGQNSKSIERRTKLQVSCGKAARNKRGHQNRKIG